MHSPNKSSLVDSFVGKYKVTREIGRGGFGVVYEVVQQSIGHRAAAKMLSPALASDPKHQKYIERFAEAGADFVSIGALTHSVIAADVSLEVKLD